MSCNCGCHDNRPPATGWRKFVPLIVGVAVVGALIAAAVLKKDARAKEPAATSTAQTAPGPLTGR
ncbi:hypothetical protein PHYC_00559 [Phycisphaerales bacterium]|nr:hypothetical protein PHYC_00559 [Phycisphaerales bacterium]